MEADAEDSSKLLLLEQVEQSNVSLKWNGRKVPDFIFDKMCSEHVEKIGHEERAPMEALEHTAIPAWLLALKANLFLWIFWLVFPIIAFVGSSCNGTGFADAPSYLLIVFGPILFISLYLELRCYRVMFPAILMHLGPYRICGFIIPLELWLFGVICLSAVTHTDLATNGLFVARIAKTARCGESKVESVWDEVNAKSLFHGRLPSLVVLCIGLWLLMALQLLFALYHSWPCQPIDEADLSFVDLTRLRRDKPVHQVFGIQTMGGQVWPSDAIQALADSARMRLVNFRYLDFLLKARGPRLEYGHHCRRTWVRSIRMITLRIFGVVFLENLVFANLQATVLAIDKAVENRIDWITALSTSLSLFTALTSLTTAAWQLYNMVPMIWKFINNKASKEPPGQPAINKCSLIMSMALFSVTSLLCLFGIYYTFMKIYMTAACSHGVWNLSGCVDLTFILDQPAR